MEGINAPFLITIGLTLVGTISVAGGRLIWVTWKLQETIQGIRDGINANYLSILKMTEEHQQSDNSEFVRLREQMRNQYESQNRDFGETAQAIRQKMHEIETWSRDQFVRRDSFQGAMDRLTQVVNATSDRHENHLNKMEEKFSKAIDRLRERETE